MKTEFINEDREKVRDPEPCRIKHTEDNEEQTGIYRCLVCSSLMKLSDNFNVRKCSNANNLVQI